VINRIWMPAGVAFICQALGIGILGVYGFFVQPLAAEFDTGVAVINLGPVMLLLIPAFLGPVIGRYIDTHSIRTIMLIGVAIAVASLLIMSQMPTLLGVACGFLGYSLGQALYGPVSLNSMLIKLYRDKVARVLAISAMGVSVGSICWPFLVAFLMDQYDWRRTLVVLAICVAVILGLGIRLGLPRTIDMGVARSTEEGEEDWSFLRNPAFWFIGLTASAIYNVSLAVGICYAPHFNQHGFDNTQIATFLAAGGVAGICGKLLVARFADQLRAQIRHLAMLVTVVMSMGFTALIVGDSFAWAVTATALIGGSGGAFLPLHPFINSAYFSADNMGRVNGAQAPLMLPLALISAPLAGYAFDTTGSYQIAFFGAIVLLAFGLVLLVTKPQVQNVKR
jgi:predicted MFS family arabinose efflux permease